MEPKVFGEFLRKLRKDKQLKLDQVAESSGISKGYLSNIENGRRGVPSPELLMKLSEPLEVEYEELMRKAGYWIKSSNSNETNIDVSYSVNLRNSITACLKAMADDDGIFPDYLHDEIFMIFEGWLRLSEGNRSSDMFDEFYKYDYLIRPDKEDYFGKDSVKETHERFNKIYNYTAIKNEMNSYTGDKELEVFLSELIQLMEKHDLTMNIEEAEKLSEIPLQIELTDILDNSTLTSVLYKGRMLEPDERLRILGMLSVLFP
ncbi:MULTISPECIES: helix-turn-helix domain-containing protein [Paenibacillus]|uniref:helix-turn-helix domain-containing protein n=1 Tax=Paenibacillus TaxID=44249 RepID=UPI00096C8591|nr:helix-turn-helix transcriptional regulator [Paenibacillus odorifer]OME27158.1 hypothetical protein BSK57_05445 [Paenibacillus odorifer]